MRGPREHKKRQETNGKRDRTSSGQIVTIVFVSSLLHQVSLSSHAHNFNYTFTVHAWSVSHMLPSADRSLLGQWPAAQPVQAELDPTPKNKNNKITETGLGLGRPSRPNLFSTEGVFGKTHSYTLPLLFYSILFWYLVKQTSYLIIYGPLHLIFDDFIIYLICKFLL